MEKEENKKIETVIEIQKTKFHVISNYKGEAELEHLIQRLIRNEIEYNIM